MFKTLIKLVNDYRALNAEISALEKDIRKAIKLQIEAIETLSK